MSALPRCDFLSPEEYLVRERAAETRSEYWNGFVEAMAGASFEHNVIKHNVERLLGNQLATRACFVFSSDMKVRIERANLFRYPDVSVVCGPVAFYDEERDVYTNPALIVEVLSSSTRSVDRNAKFALYRLIDSFREYLLIAQEHLEVELFRKQPDGRWTSAVYADANDVVALESVNCTLRVGDLYAKVKRVADKV